MINWPVPPSGSSNEASFMRKLVDACKRSVPKAGPGILAQESSDGIHLQVNLPNAGTNGTKAWIYQITSLVSDDYVMAQLIDSAGNPTGGNVAVAKSVTGQMNDGATIDTYLITYAYTDDNNRVATAALLGTEVQVMHPRYQVNDLMVVIQLSVPMMELTDDGTDVMPVLDGNGNTIQLYEISPARIWCAAPDGFTPPGS